MAISQCILMDFMGLIDGAGARTLGRNERVSNAILSDGHIGSCIKGNNLINDPQ
jgi:hypothetical protein